MDPTQLDLAQYTAVTAASIFAVYILVSIFKPPLELAMPATHPLHDWAVRTLSLVCGILIVLVATALRHPLTGPAVFLAIVQGVAAALSAIGTYHLLSTSGPDGDQEQPAIPSSTDPSAAGMPPTGGIGTMSIGGGSPPGPGG